MTEETNTTATAPVTDQNTNNNQVAFKPAWQIAAEGVEQDVKNGKGVQVIYKSTDENYCEPMLATKERKDTIWPEVIEKPNGFIAPKYDWGHGKWMETFSVQQAKDIENLKAQVSTLNKNDQITSQNTKNIADYEKTNSQQIGQLVTMVSSLLAKSATPETTPAAPKSDTNSDETTSKTENEAKPTNN